MDQYDWIDLTFTIGHKKNQLEHPELVKVFVGDNKLTFHKCFLTSFTATEGTIFIVAVQGVQRGISEFRSKSRNFILAVLNGNDSTSPYFKHTI